MKLFSFTSVVRAQLIATTAVVAVMVGAAGAQTKAAKGPLDGTWDGPRLLKVSGGTYTISDDVGEGPDGRIVLDHEKGTFVISDNKITMTMTGAQNQTDNHCFDALPEDGKWYSEAQNKTYYEKKNKSGAGWKSDWEERCKKTEYMPKEFTYKLAGKTLTLTGPYVDPEDGKTKTRTDEYEKVK